MCEIDWKLLIELLKSTSIFAASLVALFGINSWRRQAKWKKQFEVAENVLSLFYEARDVISIMRSNYQYVGEGQTRKRNKNEDENLSNQLDIAYIQIERFKTNRECFNKLRASKYKFLAVFKRASILYP